MHHLCTPQPTQGCCLSKEGVDAAGDMAVLALQLAQQGSQRELLTEHATTALVLLLLEAEVCFLFVWCVCVCVCVKERERVRESECV